MISLADLQQKTPRLFSREETLEALGSPSLLIFRALSTVTLHVGQEHSVFVEQMTSEARRSGQRPEELKPMFQDEGRFTGQVALRDFYLSDASSGMAAGKGVSLDILGTSPLARELQNIRCFVGKESQSSSLHFDWNPEPNFLVNLTGKKNVVLFSPEQSRRLQGYCNFSSCQDVGEYTFTLHEGEALLIPPFWWHQAHYLSTACSLSLRLKGQAASPIGAHLYPSWKALALDEDQRSELLTDLPQDLNKLYQHVETFYNERLDHNPADDHPNYELWSKGYLAHFRSGK